MKATILNHTEFAAYSKSVAAVFQTWRDVHQPKLSGANPFDYLTQLQRHAGDLVRNPWQWMPWNYQATLESSGACLDSG